MSDHTTESPPPISLRSALKKPTEELQEPEGSPPRRPRLGAADEEEIQSDLDKPIYDSPYDMATSCTQNRNRCFMSRNKPNDPEYINEWKLCHTSPGGDAEDGCRYSTHLERVIPDCVKADTSRCPRPSVGASRDSQYLDWQRWYDGNSEFGDWWKGVKFSQGTKRTVDQRPYDPYSKEHMGPAALAKTGVTPAERQARVSEFHRGKRVFPSNFTPQDIEAVESAAAADAAAAASSSSVGGRRTKRRKSKRKPSKKLHGRKTRGRKTRLAKRKTRQAKRNKRKTKRHTRRGRKTRGRKTKKRRTGGLLR